MASDYLAGLLGAVFLAWLAFAFWFQKFKWFRATFCLLLINIGCASMLCRAIELALAGRTEDRWFRPIWPSSSLYWPYVVLWFGVPILGFIFGNYLVIRSLRRKSGGP